MNYMEELFTTTDENELEDLQITELLATISAKIVNERLSRKMNQKEFGELLNVSQSMISKLESYEYNPTIKTLFLLAKKLGLELEIKLEKEKAYKEIELKRNKLCKSAWGKTNKVSPISFDDITLRNALPTAG